MVEGSGTQKGSSGSHHAHICKAGDTREVSRKVVKHEFSSVEMELLLSAGIVHKLLMLLWTSKPFCPNSVKYKLVFPQVRI